MAVTKAKKSEVLNDLIERLKNAKSVWFSTTNWMTVQDFDNLRKELRTVNSSYTLAKKTLIKIAVKEVYNLDLDLELIPGQIWVICSNNDAIAWLSKTNDFIKKIFNKKVEVQKIDWAASIFEWKVNWLEETKVIASMPSRETLLGRLVGSMQSPIAGLARFFDAAAKDLESKGKSKVGELKGEKTVEAPKAEVKEEVKATEEVPAEKAEWEETKAE
jgi:large subunit ribosomal protein L10